MSAVVAKGRQERGWPSSLRWKCCLLFRSVRERPNHFRRSRLRWRPVDVQTGSRAREFVHSLQIRCAQRHSRAVFNITTIPARTNATDEGRDSNAGRNPFGTVVGTPSAVTRRDAARREEMAWLKGGGPVHSVGRQATLIDRSRLAFDEGNR
jgi:hypothetical protein